MCVCVCVCVCVCRCVYVCVCVYVSVCVYEYLYSHKLQVNTIQTNKQKENYIKISSLLHN